MSEKKMYETIKSLARDTVELELDHIMQDEAYLKGLKTEEYKEVEQKINEFQKNIPYNDELEGLKNELTELEIRYYFKCGVIAGLTSLKFLEEVGESIVTI